MSNPTPGESPASGSPVPSTDDKPSFGRALGHRPFLLLWLSQLISQSGDFVFEVALLWLVLETTRSVFAVGLVVAVAALPSVVVGPFLGVLVDRWDRRGILVVTNVLEGLLVAGLSGLVLAHAASLPVILAIVFALGTGGQFVRTTSSAMVPRLVTTADLAPANSLMSVSSSFNQIVGLSIGGVVVALFGVTLPIEYDALSFFAAALIVAGIARAVGSVSVEERTAQPGFVAQFREGLSFIRAHRFFPELIALGIIVNFFGNAVAALFAPYAKLSLHGGPSTYGFLGAAVAVGSIVGAVAVGKVDTRRRAGKFAFVGGVATGLTLIALGFTASVPLALVEVTLAGVALAVTNIPLGVVIQAKVPGRLLGRVVAAFSALITLSAPAGAFFAGAFASATSVGTVIVVSGVGVAASLGLGWFVMTDVRDVTY